MAGKGIAFLDFDNTVIHGDVGPMFGHYLVGRRFETVRDEKGKRAARRDRAKIYARLTPYMTWLAIQSAFYKARAARRSTLVRSAYRTLRGVPAEEYYSMMREFADLEMPARIYPDIRDAMHEHLRAGRRVVIITTGIEELVKQCLVHLPDGVEVIGCRLEEKDGKLTGRAEGPLYGADKANIINAYCQAAGVDPADCWAYTDHYSDYHMLAAVGHGVCVNPRSRLERMANEKGWTVIRPTAPVQSG